MYSCNFSKNFGENMGTSGHGLQYVVTRFTLFRAKDLSLE